MSYLSGSFRRVSELSLGVNGESMKNPDPGLWTGLWTDF